MNSVLECEELWVLVKISRNSREKKSVLGKTEWPKDIVTGRFSNQHVVEYTGPSCFRETLLRLSVEQTNELFN